MQGGKKDHGDPNGPTQEASAKLIVKRPFSFFWVFLVKDFHFDRDIPVAEREHPIGKLLEGGQTLTQSVQLHVLQEG